MRKFETMSRVRRTIAVVHAEAFQLMLYATDRGEQVLIWNSRDGVTPFCTWLGESGQIGDGREYRHAMGRYQPRYSAVLPDIATHVWVSYTPESWAAMVRRAYEIGLARPVPDDWQGSTFAETFPTVDAYIAARPFEHGQPRLLTREEFLAQTPEWMGKSDIGQPMEAPTGIAQ